MKLFFISLNGSLFLSALFFSKILFAASAPAKIPAPQQPINTPGFNFKTAANFDDLRHNILELIATGKKRVWLLTDSLADGEIASALYTAKARNLDTKVYLGRDQLNTSGSRLPYLRSQSIPAYLRPRTGYTAPTFLFVDQRLYAFTRDLNGVQKFGGAEIIQASPADVKAFVTWLKEVMVNPEIAYPRAFRAGRSVKEPFQGDSEGSYNYDRKSTSGRKAPEGVTRELPRVPKWKQTEELRRQGVTVPVTPPSPQTPDAPVIEEETKTDLVPAPEVEGAKEPEALPPGETAPAVKPWTPAPIAPETQAAPVPAAEPVQPTTTSP